MMLDVTLDAARQAINELDLNNVIKRLTKKDAWKSKRAQAAVIQYRNYLWLLKKYGSDHHLPPSKDIDEVWHSHILHTRQYQQDCHTIFGSYLHHEPEYFQTNTIDAKQHAERFAKTQELYKQEFGDYIYEINPENWLNKCLLSIIEAMETFINVFRKISKLSTLKRIVSFH